MSDPVLYEQDGHVVTITLNRPETRNPISEAGMVDGIVAALERINRDPSVRCAILTGAGSAFSSGGDLKKMHEGLGQRSANPTETRYYYSEGIQRIPLAFEKVEVPVIAAVNGAAIGAGNDLTCMCDIRIAGESAKFAESFVKVGIIPGDGGAWLLPRVVGYSKACEMAFTGDILNAQEALACRLVSKVVPDAELMATARAMAARRRRTGGSIWISPRGCGWIIRRRPRCFRIWRRRRTSIGAGCSICTARSSASIFR